MPTALDIPFGAPSPADAAKLHESIDAGYLLPTEWYGDPTLFRVELRRIHQRAWHFATHTGDLKSAGDVYVRNIAGAPIVLTRDEQGSIRGFINICRHRGHPVVLSSGNQPKLRCHQHSWTYGLDGALQQAPRRGGQRQDALPKHLVEREVAGRRALFAFRACGQPLYQHLHEERIAIRFSPLTDQNAY